MKELNDILSAGRMLKRENREFALATVVRIGGSTYRRPGARMLVDGEGRRWGTISGGCLEGEVAEQARAVIDARMPQLLPFDLSDDDVVLGFGAGCNGVVHVLLEPVPAPGRSDPIDLLGRCLEGRRQGIGATVIEARGALARHLGRRLVVLDDGTEAGCLRDVGPLYDAVAADARDELEGEPRHGPPRRVGAGHYAWETRAYAGDDGSIQVLFERLRPPVRLLVFGEGHDVPPVVRFAKGMGWSVVVVGRRAPERLAARFPEADEHRFLMHPEDALAQVAHDPWTAALVMNHNYARDRALLRELLAAPIPYVGLLGPRERTERMLDELRAAGALPDAPALDRLFGPVGLDIGTETPEEIALSIVAEVQAVLHDRPGSRLRERDTPIHGARSKLVA